MKKVLVTGASGFIGRHTLPILSAKGYEVHAIDLNLPKDEQREVFWHKADLFDAGQVTAVMSEIKPDMLLHFAWYAVPKKYWTSPENPKWVDASFALLKRFHSEGGRRAVMAGTCAEYDWKFERCSEFTTPLQPSTLYGRCKKSLWEMADAFSKEAGLSSAWGRVFFLYGPHEHPDRLVPFVINSLMSGKPCGLSHGRQVRDFLYVEDVASAFAALLESDVRGPVNIGSGDPMSIRELVTKIGEKIGRLDLIRFGEKEAPADEPLRLEADTGRLTGEVKWSPRYSLGQGISKTIQWWKEK